MDLNKKHKEILTQLLFGLLDKGYINHPCQVAIGTLDLTEKKDSYSYFSSDVFPILNFMHPLLSRKDKLTYSRQMKMFINIEDNDLLKKDTFNGINNKGLNDIGKNYERLRRIKIKNSVSSVFFKDCLRRNISQSDMQILKNSLDYIETDPYGKLLVELEEILFLWGNNPYYQCTFYNYKTNKANLIFHTIVFCQEENCVAIAELTKYIIKNNKKVKLLEDFDDSILYKLENDNEEPVNINNDIILLESAISKKKLDTQQSSEVSGKWSQAQRLFDTIKSELDPKSVKSLLESISEQSAAEFFSNLSKIKK